MFFITYIHLNEQSLCVYGGWLSSVRNCCIQMFWKKPCSSETSDAASIKPASQPGAVLTSQCGREQEVRPVFPDDVVSDGAETGTPAQLPNGLQELGVQRQGEAIVLLSLQGEAVHLPAAELPATQATRTRTSAGGQAVSSPNSQQNRKKIKTSSRSTLLAFNTQNNWRAWCSREPLCG